MTDESDRVPAARLRFNPQEAFPPEDPMSLPLLRLMAATNDALLHQKHAIINRERAETAGDLDKAILNGDLGYHVRMLCGHLFEAGRAFRSLYDAVSDLLKGDAEAEQALALLQEIYGDTSEASFYATVLGRIRNLAAFHYKEEQFKDGVVAFGDAPADIVISPHRGIGRYVITDQILSRSVWEFAGGTQDKFSEMVSKAITLADALGVVVSHLLIHLFDSRHVKFEQQHGKLMIEAEIWRMKKKVDDERQKQSRDS